MCNKEDSSNCNEGYFWVKGLALFFTYFSFFLCRVQREMRETEDKLETKDRLVHGVVMVWMECPVDRYVHEPLPLGTRWVMCHNAQCTSVCFVVLL